MKRIALILMTMLLTLTCAACGQEKGAENVKPSANTASAAPAETKSAGKSLVVYFSATDNTARLANTMASALGADILELKPAQPYTSQDLDYNAPGNRSTAEQRDDKARPQLAAPVGDLKQYDTIYIGYPIWWYIAPRIVYTFVESVDLTGKKVVPFCTSGGSGIGASGEGLAEAAKGKGNWVRGREFSPGASGAQIKEWASKL